MLTRLTEDILNWLLVAHLRIQLRFGKVHVHAPSVLFMGVIRLMFAAFELSSSNHGFGFMQENSIV